MVDRDGNLKLGYIVSYPPANQINGHFDRGMAWYMQKLLSAMPQDGFQYRVYANVIKGESNYTRIGEHIEIIRCWDRKPSFVYQIIRTINWDLPDIVHLQFEFFEFGTGISAFLVPVLLLYLRFWGIPVITGIVSLPGLKTIKRDLLKIYGFDYLPVFVIKSAFKLLINSAAALSDVVVVAQTGGETFAETLVDDYGIQREKIVVTPMPTEECTDRMDKSEARARLNILEDTKMLLFFGFLAGYKGIEMLIDAFGILAHRHPEMQLIIAGGETPGLKARDGTSYLLKLKEMAAATGAPIQFTGFVPNQEITLYFSAADLLILPYVAGLSSSGPLVLAMAYDCPFIASTALSRVINLESALFKYDLESLVLKVEEFFEDTELRQNIKDYIYQFKHEYSWTQLSKETVALYLNIMAGI